jgi:hypothetical protein
MPTGYTAGVEDGTITEFPDFALRCARAFGALVQMRDERMDAPIPDTVPVSSYYATAVQKARAALQRLSVMSAADKSRAASEDYERRSRDREDYRARQVVELNRYQAMLAKVVAWTPPTAEHEGLKRFMLEQLHTSIRDPYDYPAPVALSAESWHQREVTAAEESLVRREEDLAKEQARANERTEWLRQLRASLQETLA